MKSLLRKSVIVITAVVCLYPAAAAKADLWKDVITGLNLFDIRFSGERNLLGDGWTVNANATYVDRTFDMGIADLTLNGLVSGSAGFTRRFIPGAKFSLTTGGGTNALQPLTYDLDFHTGVQDLKATGNVMVNVDTRINALGFYEETLQISNRGTYTLDGYALNQSDTLDYDVGPIVVKGNVFADLLAALTQPFFGATGANNPFAKIGALAGKSGDTSLSYEALQARLAAGGTLSEQEIAALVNNTLVAALLGGQPSNNLFDGVLFPKDLLDGGADTPLLPRDALAGGALPEPATLALLILGLALIRPRSSR